MGSYEVTRSTTIDAPVPLVHALIEDFHEWVAWSPWEDVDPDLQRTYSGAARGAGARYEWHGNRKAGAGTMQVRSSTAESIAVDVQFTRPFRSESTSEFTLRPDGPRTEVTWTMRGEQTGVMAVVGKVLPTDRLLGKDFEKGLARLKAVAESR